MWHGMTIYYISTHLYRVTESHDVDWHVTGSQLPTSQQLFCYRVIIAVFLIIIVQLAPIQCVAPLAANNLQSGLSSASSVASSTLRLWNDRSFFIVANRKLWGRPASLFLSLWVTAVRILLASADSSILAKRPNSIRHLFWIIEVRGGCSVIRHTSQFMITMMLLPDHCDL